MQLLTPLDAATPAAGSPLDLYWRSTITATVFRVELADETGKQRASPSSDGSWPSAREARSINVLAK